MNPKMVIITTTPAIIASVTSNYVGLGEVTRSYGLLPTNLRSEDDIASMFGSGPLSDPDNISGVYYKDITATLTIVAFMYKAPNEESVLENIGILPITGVATVLDIEYFPSAEHTDILIQNSLEEYTADLVSEGVLTTMSF
jgi:hypothetical protein